MKKTIGIFMMFFTCFLLIGINYAGSDSDGTLTMKSFSVNAPRGWTVEKAGDDRVVFRTAGARSGEASIVVAADPVSGPEAGENAWRKIRSVATYKNGITYEGEDRFSGETWRKIVYGDEVRGLKLRCAALYSQEGEIRCMIRFSCPENRFDAMLPYFNSVKESFSFAPGTRT
jgi:hypothetical protein